MKRFEDEEFIPMFGTTTCILTIHFTFCYIWKAGSLTRRWMMMKQGYPGFVCQGKMNWDNACYGMELPGVFAYADNGSTYSSCYVLALRGYSVVRADEFNEDGHGLRCLRME
jgi:hypothetical protein